MSGIFADIEPQSAYDDAWFRRLDRSLEFSSDKWLRAVLSTETLSDDYAWSLLSWIEMASSELVRSRSRVMLETAAFARAILERSRLDARDIALVETLLRRGAMLSGVNYLDAVVVGCARAGVLGETALDSLLSASSMTPSTYREVGRGRRFSFRRVTSKFDAVELMQRSGDGKDPATP